ncbi:MAG: metallophosphoesterase [Burkholderiales bacterium]
MLAAVVAAGLAGHAGAAAIAVEFYHATYGHYFVTASAAEIAALDHGTLPGWVRTGESFGVFDVDTVGTANVCRFWTGQTYAPKSSHFYTPVPAECTTVKDNPDWQYEGLVFAWGPTDAAGACAGVNVPLYRLYNDGKGGAPNHRYTTKTSIRAQMIAQGWIPEGSGIGVIGCVPPVPTTIVAAGDIAQCFNAPAAQSAAARTAAIIAPADAMVLTLGDHAYDTGTASEFANCYDPTWGHAAKSRTRPAPGNHDYYTQDAAAYFDYFGAAAGPDRRGWYSFDFAGWHFIALNSLTEVQPGSPQYEWLKADLARTRDTLCTIAYWHFPAFNSGADYGSVLSMRPMFEALYDGGVEIVLSGHEHIYERYAPQRADGTADPLRGVRQFVVGTGGHTLNGLGDPVANSEYRQNTRHGLLRLTLGDGTYGWVFQPTGGDAPMDSGTGTCHR